MGRCQRKQQVQRHWGRPRLPHHLLTRHGAFTRHIHELEPCGQRIRSPREVTLGRAYLGWMGEGWAGHRVMSTLEELKLEERGEGRRLPIRGTSLREGGLWEVSVAGLQELPAGPVGPGGWGCCELTPATHLDQRAVDPSWGRSLWDSCPWRLLGEG